MAETLGARRRLSRIFLVTTGGLGTPPALLTNLPPISLADGRIDFRNFIPGLLDNPVFGFDGVALAGTNYVAQLFVGDSGNNLREVSSAVPFATGTAAGYWQAGTNETIMLDNVAAGDSVIAQVKIWDAASAATYEAAPIDKRRRSNAVTIVTGGVGTPPALLTGLGFISLAPIEPGNYLLDLPKVG